LQNSHSNIAAAILSS